MAIAVGTWGIGYLWARLLGPEGLRPVELGSGTTYQIIQFTGLGAVVVLGLVFLGARWLYRVLERKE